MECPGNPADPRHARAPQPGKWALVRSLNQTFKTYAVMPVRPGGGWRIPDLLGLGFPACQKLGGRQELRMRGTTTLGSLTAGCELDPSPSSLARRFRMARSSRLGWARSKERIPSFCWCPEQGASPAGAQASIW
jgi:hypothetical protein